MLILKKFIVKNLLDGTVNIIYNTIVRKKLASVAQSVVQLIRNQQVACSSHVTSSNPKIPLNKPFLGILFYKFALCKVVYLYTSLVFSILFFMPDILDILKNYKKFCKNFKIMLAFCFGLCYNNPCWRYSIWVWRSW